MDTIKYQHMHVEGQSDRKAVCRLSKVTVTRMVAYQPLSSPYNTPGQHKRMDNHIRQTSGVEGRTAAIYGTVTMARMKEMERERNGDNNA